MNPKLLYRGYLADDSTVKLNKLLCDEILKCEPNHVFEFGCGTGKNLRLLQKQKSDLPCTGLDISLVNVIHTNVKNKIACVIIGDENYLRHLCNYDIVFTCSVLDHIEVIDGIVDELKRISNKAVFIAECIDHLPEMYYFKHDYESLGFELIPDSYYFSNSDGHNYYIWKWNKVCAESPVQ